MQILLVITSDGSYQRTQADSFSLGAGAKFCYGINVFVEITGAPASSG